MFIKRSVRRYQPRRSPTEGQASAPERLYVSYAVIESYRDELGRPRQRTLITLGADPSLARRQGQLEADHERLGAQLAAAQARGERVGALALRRRRLERIEADIAHVAQIAAALGARSRLEPAAPR